MLNNQIDKATVSLLVWIYCFLAFSTAVSLLLKRTLVRPGLKEVITNLLERMKAWWVMVLIFTITLFIGGIGSTVLFGIVSFLALREFFALAPPTTKKADIGVKKWIYFTIIPFQYYLVATKWYGFYSIFVPVYVLLFVPVFLAIADDYENFVGRATKVQWALIVCVYFVSYAPALLMLEIPGFEKQNMKLLLFLVIVVTASDVFQYIFGKLFGRIKIIPHVSPNKTAEGLVGGVITAVILGVLLRFMTPFEPAQAAVISLIIALMGFLGGITMSAIKREHGIKDYGTLLPGHGGIMDRMDSLCFAAPVFFHVVRYYFT